MRAQNWVSCASQNDFPHESEGIFVHLGINDQHSLWEDVVIINSWATARCQTWAWRCDHSHSKRSLVAPWGGFRASTQTSLRGALWCSSVAFGNAVLMPPGISSSSLPPALQTACHGSCWPSRICTETELWQLASPLNIEVRGVAAQARRWERLGSRQELCCTARAPVFSNTELRGTVSAPKQGQQLLEGWQEQGQVVQSSPSACLGMGWGCGWDGKGCKECLGCLELC